MANYGIIDLCCGMGGFSYAAQKANLSIWAGIDTSHAALSSFKENFPNALSILGDISNNILIEQIKSNIETKRSNNGLIVISGPPCQGFSDAGTRCVDDPRNEVLVSVAKAIVLISPDAALVENVSALSKAKNTQVLHRFQAVLNTAGYHVHSLEINALEFGVAQNRRRLIYFILPFRVKKKRIQDELIKFHRPTKKVKDILDDLPIPPVRPISYDPSKDYGAIANHYAMQHSDKVKQKILTIEPGKGPLSYRKLNPESFAATLISGHRAPPAHYDQPRSITAREALRLQGFPDSFRLMGPFSKQMEQATNAVPAPLGEAVIDVIVSFLGGAR